MGPFVDLVSQGTTHPQHQLTRSPAAAGGAPPPPPTHPPTQHPPPPRSLMAAATCLSSRPTLGLPCPSSPHALLNDAHGRGGRSHSAPICSARASDKLLSYCSANLALQLWKFRSCIQRGSSSGMSTPPSAPRTSHRSTTAQHVLTHHPMLTLLSPARPPHHLLEPPTTMRANNDPYCCCGCSGSPIRTSKDGSASYYSRRPLRYAGAASSLACCAGPCFGSHTLLRLGYALRGIHDGTGLAEQVALSS